MTRYPFGGQTLEWWQERIAALSPGGDSPDPALRALTVRRNGLVVGDDGVVKVSPELTARIMARVEGNEARANEARGREPPHRLLTRDTVTAAGFADAVMNALSVPDVDVTTAVRSVTSPPPLSWAGVSTLIAQSGAPDRVASLHFSRFER